MRGTARLLDNGALRTDFTVNEADELVHIGHICNRLATTKPHWPAKDDELYTTELDEVLSILAGNGTLTGTQDVQLIQLASLIGPFQASGFGDDTYNGFYVPHGTHGGFPVYQNANERLIYVSGDSGAWVMNDTIDDGRDVSQYGDGSSGNPPTSTWFTGNGTAPSGTVATL